MTQTQHLPHQLEGLPPLTPANEAYSHVLFHWLFITVTRRSLQLATATSCLTFATLQVKALISADTQIQNTPATPPHSPLPLPYYPMHYSVF